MGGTGHAWHCFKEFGGGLSLSHISKGSETMAGSAFGTKAIVPIFGGINLVDISMPTQRF